MLVFLLHLLIVATDCQPQEWSQSKADPFHSSSIRVNDNRAPPKPQTLTYLNSNPFTCTPVLNQMILTSNGRLIGSSYCPGSFAYNWLFGEAFQPNGSSWKKTIQTNYLNNLVMSADGKHAILQTWDRSFAPLILDPLTGETTRIQVPYEFIQSESIMSCPNTDHLFLLQGSEKILQLNPTNRTVYETGASFRKAYLQTDLVSDPLGPRVARVIHDDPTTPKTCKIIVWEVQKTSPNKVKLNQLWFYNFYNYGEMNYATPTYARNGNLYFVASANYVFPQTFLFILDKNGKTRGGFPFKSDFINPKGLSVTSDGNYAIVWFDKGAVVVKTNGTKVIHQTYGTNADLTAVDEENSIFYSATDCQLTAYCLKHNAILSQTICDSPAKISKMLLGKYSRGQRRLFVGFEGIVNVTKVQILDTTSTTFCV